MINPTKIVDIPTWLPQNYDEIVGNEELKQLLSQTASSFLSLRNQSGTNQVQYPRLLIGGESRSGKSSIIKLFNRQVLCQEYDVATNKLCDYTCYSCQSKEFIHGAFGLHQLRSEGVQLFTIDCTQIVDSKSLENKLDEIVQFARPGDPSIIWLDEAHRLKARRMEDMLLPKTEQIEAMWILSTAHPNDLEDMLRKRLEEVPTTPPTNDQLVMWLAKRCVAWHIPAQPDAIRRIAEKSNYVPGIALKGLAKAQRNLPEGLTLALAENWRP